MEEGNVAMDNIEREISDLKSRVGIVETEITNVKINNGKQEEKTNQLFSLLSKIEISIEKNNTKSEETLNKFDAKMQKSLDNIGTKIDNLEGKNGKKWDSMVSGVILAIATGVIIFFLSGGHF